MGKKVKLLKKMYYDLPVNIKLNLTNILIIVIPMILLAFLANKVSSDIIIEKSINNSVQELTVVTRSIDSLLNQVEYLSKLTANNYNIQQILTESENDIANFLAKRNDAVSSLDSIVGEQDIITSALVFTNEGSIFSSSKVGTYKISVDDKDLSDILNMAQNQKGKVIWRNTRPIDYYIGKQNVNCVSLFRALINRNTGQVMGSIELDVDQKTIAQLFSISDNIKMGDTFIINKSGQIVSSSNESKLFQKIDMQDYFSWIIHNNNSGKVFTIENSRYLVTSVQYERLGWYMVSVIPLKKLMEDTEKVTNLIFFISLICISLAVITSIFNSRAITKPIISLSKDMSYAGQGDMEVRATVFGNDEVGTLSKSFNTMMERISHLMDKVYDEQKKKRNFELQALQSQINPHFLYNTLESICSLANKNRNEDVVIMVKSLALFYRSVLSKGRNVITIKEEIDNIKSYLSIQKIRYGQKFDYTIDIDKSILDKSIVKLTLQPLVENSIYHGIRQKRSQGTIIIHGTIVREVLKISVQDDGIGFDENECIRILTATVEEKELKNYGLKNVHERIKLYFGPEYGLNISSSPGQGTRVEVVLPSIAYEI